MECPKNLYNLINNINEFFKEIDWYEIIIDHIKKYKKLNDKYIEYIDEIYALIKDRAKKTKDIIPEKEDIGSFLISSIFQNRNMIPINYKFAILNNEDDIDILFIDLQRKFYKKMRKYKSLYNKLCKIYKNMGHIIEKRDLADSSYPLYGKNIEIKKEISYIDDYAFKRTGFKIIKNYIDYYRYNLFYKYFKNINYFNIDFIQYRNGDKILIDPLYNIKDKNLIELIEKLLQRRYDRHMEMYDSQIKRCENKKLIKKSKDKFIKDYKYRYKIHKLIKKKLNKKKDIIIINIGLRNFYNRNKKINEFNRDKEFLRSHANVLIIDKYKKEIIYFDPHGGDSKIYSISLIRDAIINLLKDIGIKTKDNYTLFYGKKLFITKDNPQFLDEYCQSWCLFYTFLRLLYYDLTPQEIEFMIRSVIKKNYYNEKNNKNLQNIYYPITNKLDRVYLIKRIENFTIWILRENNVCKYLLNNIKIC